MQDSDMLKVMDLLRKDSVVKVSALLTVSPALSSGWSYIVAKQ